MVQNYLLFFLENVPNLGFEPLWNLVTKLVTMYVVYSNPSMKQEPFFEKALKPFFCRQNGVKTLLCHQNGVSNLNGRGWMDLRRSFIPSNCAARMTEEALKSNEESATQAP